MTGYIKNRDEISESIQGDGKTIFLKIINGSKIETENPFLIKFKHEIKLIHKNLCGLNPVLFKSIKLRQEYDNIENE